MQEQSLSNVNKVKITAEVDDDGNLVAAVKFQATTSPHALARLANFLKNGGPITCAFQTPQLAFDLLLTEVKPVDARAEEPPKAKKPAADKPKAGPAAEAKPSDNGKGTKDAAASAVPAEKPTAPKKETAPA